MLLVTTTTQGPQAREKVINLRTRYDTSNERRGTMCTSKTPLSPKASVNAAEKIQKHTRTRRKKAKHNGNMYPFVMTYESGRKCRDR